MQLGSLSSPGSHAAHTCPLTDSSAPLPRWPSGPWQSHSPTVSSTSCSSNTGERGSKRLRGPRHTGHMATLSSKADINGSLTQGLIEPQVPELTPCLLI